ncbi:MAG: ornithine carbamoyltransferase [Methanophagales archaeon ANME-1-THS]|nr:MAG: ornithine carbamoyltransferase [Methanophagales archaeon ANME-1-THS]
MNLISIFDLTQSDLAWIIERGEELKRARKTLKTGTELAGKTLALIFEKPSTRTRVSFEVAMHELGGNVISLNWNELQLGRGERVRDTAKVLSSYVDAVMIRAYQHDTVVEFANAASIPVINGLTNFEHPCQTLADLMTIKEYKNRFAGITVAWIGDGNNVCNSLIGGAALTGMHMRVGCPLGYAPAAAVLEEAKRMGCEVLITDDAEQAVADADVLYTDVWVSMGDEQERERRERDLSAYQLNEEMVRRAKEDAIIMHCMPVHVGEEITEAVLTSKNSVIFEQAENRLHAQKALLLRLFRD